MKLPQQVSAVARKADRNAAVAFGANVSPSALADLLKLKPWQWDMIPDYRPGGPFGLPPNLQDLLHSTG